MHRPFITINLSALLVLFLTLACSTDRNSHPLFIYEVSDSDSHVFLYGSVHVLSESDYPLDPVIDQAFSNSEILALEVHPDSLTKPSTRELMREKAYLPDAPPLSERLHKETYTLLKVTAENSGIPIQTYQQVEPWFAALSLTMQKLESLGFSSEYGVEIHFYQNAIQAGKKIEGLEMVYDQVALFDSLSAEDQDNLVMQSLIDLAVLENEFQVLLEAWKHGQTERLGTLLLQSFKDYPDIYRELVVNRNKNWLIEIEDYLNSNEKAFIVVGAAHLAGPDGLVNLLMQDGFSVKQLQSQD
ncbi:TraB/GumN family protein [candidate division KSB1 bacterium]|nr:TraB/GumN family protein [candidate division KSB1 bacterium]